ncbi:diuretic hormone receptor-like isoform X2 [Tigriopus californicus]|uniref:diuretic hormone receptor-like isoform X2 n=1 Tax=Tigriopus californicus TaxID=6832 RepID=UPI0027DA9BD8|nr:diuretic hormone receptor-like isoform X2 [Tigriopus californicus]
MTSTTFENVTCSNFCNITNPVWCKNFMLGLSTLHCSTEDCEKNLCQEVALCEDLAESNPIFEASGQDFCPIVFDGWSCVNSTPAGSTIKFPCPNFLHLNFDKENLAYRECSSEGHWFDIELNKSFTHYEQCPDVHSFKMFDLINKVYMAGYVISLVFLCLATLIFMQFRSLKCVRNTIHTNLFVASILHNLLWLVWYCVIYQMGSISEWSEVSLVACKVLQTLVQYFTVCTYFWMLCEGLYLFVVLIVTFISESRVLIGLCTLGWVCPGVLILLYVLLRTLSSEPGHHELCWMEDTPYNWVYKLPCILTIFINLVFLARIVHVLVAKLHKDVSDRAALIKTARAIGVLVPLFGLHNFLAAVKPDEGDSTLRIIMEFLCAITTSFQGLVIAILFCLINSEVSFQLKKFFGDHIDTRHQSMAMTQYTVRTTRLGSITPHPHMAALRQEFLVNRVYDDISEESVSMPAWRNPNNYVRGNASQTVATGGSPPNGAEDKSVAFV